MTVFTQKGCAPCTMLKYWLKQKELDYEEIDIEPHVDTLRSLGFFSAPVVKIGDRYFNGANISAVAQHLGV